MPQSLSEFHKNETAWSPHPIPAIMVDFPDSQAGEILTVAYLDQAGRLAHIISHTDKKSDAVSLSIRTIVHEALIRGHDRFLLLHNHPSGNPQPSQADIIATRLMCRIAAPLGLELVDHLILAPHACFSFRTAGLI
ncbi:MAG: DNA repair protein [Alphaproteobacteria bacterium]|nr:DNA repair protein [Alphaproteobacteria bacterium]